MIISLPGTGIARFRTESPGERSSIGKKVKVKDRSESGLPGNFARVVLTRSFPTVAGVYGSPRSVNTSRDEKS